MATTIWPTDAISQPVYAFWQLAFFVRSGVIVGIWLVADSLIRVSPQLLCSIFSSLKVDNRTIRAFNTNILSTNDENGVQVAGRILSCYTWAVLSSVVFSVVFLWNSLIVRTWSFDVGYVALWNSAVRDCLEGSMCYALDSNNDIYHIKTVGLEPLDVLKRALWWDLAPACDFLVNQADSLAAYKVTRERSRRYRVMLCHRLWPQQSLPSVFGKICVGVAILIVQKALFEALVLLMLRESKHRFRTFSVFVVILAAVLVGIYVVLTIRDTFWGISTSSADVAALLAIAVILAQAKRLSRIIRTLREVEKESKMKKLQETSLGQEIDRAFCCGDNDSQVPNANSDVFNDTKQQSPQMPHTPSGSNSTIRVRARAQNFLQKLLNKQPAEN